MGFVVVEYRVLLTREEVIKLLIDSENVEKTTIDGENIIIMGSGISEKFSDYENGGLKHIFRTSVDFKDHNEYLWTTITLTTKDKVTYQGVINPLNPS